MPEVEAERIWYEGLRTQIMAEARTEQGMRKLAALRVSDREAAKDAAQAAAAEEFDLGVAVTDGSKVISPEEAEGVQEGARKDLKAARKAFQKATDMYHKAMHLRKGGSEDVTGDDEDNSDAQNDGTPPEIADPLFDRPSFETLTSCLAASFELYSGAQCSKEAAEEGYTAAQWLLSALLEKQGATVEVCDIVRKLVREYIRHNRIEDASLFLEKLLIVEKKVILNVSSQYIKDIALQGTLLCARDKKQEALKYYRRAITLLKVRVSNTSRLRCSLWTLSLGV